MRYIKKGASPAFFEECKAGLNEPNNWEAFSENQELSQCKKDLHQHLLDEQSGLCVYCERGIATRLDSHVEHVYPKSSYPAKAFDYGNLVASCNGDSCSVDEKKAYKPENVHSCGHRKSDLLKSTLFLSPLEHEDISDYFEYNKTSCAITASNKNPSKASYTIDLLNLDNSRLNNVRANARTALVKSLKNYGAHQKKLKARLLLSKDRPFISFLRYNFSSFLVE